MATVKVTFVIILWVVSWFLYFRLVRWAQGRFNFSVSGSQNWGAVHFLIAAFLAPYVVAFLSLVYGVTWLVDKNKNGGGDDYDI